MIRAVCCAWLVVLGSSSPATAQNLFSSPFRRISFAAGATLIGGYRVGDVTADLRRNASGAPSPFPFLRAESRIGSAPALDGRVAVHLTPSVSVEVAGSYAAPQLAVTVSGDAEAAGEITAQERLSQPAIDVSGIYQFGIGGAGARARPYAIGGAGYMWQIHEGRLRVERGRTLHGGGGILYRLRGGVGRQRPLGIRGEARVVRRSGGIEFQDRARTFLTFSALAFVSF
jgi:hypothetical protein